MQEIMYENSYPERRYKLSLEFIKKFITTEETILDLGVKNPFSEILFKSGYNVINTDGKDFDFSPKIDRKDFETVVALEILEHLVSPFPVLQQLQAKKLIATVPLKLWFTGAYKNMNNPRERHYHEFEDWQFDWLVEKSGWNIKHKEKWIIPPKSIGIRPVLRYFTPRIYAIYAER